MAKSWKWLRESWDEIVVYLSTLAAVIVAPYLGAAATGGEFNIVLKWWVVASGGVVAFWLVARNEAKGFDPADDAAKAKAKRDAKRRNIWDRISKCMGQGFIWPALIGALSTAADALNNLAG